MKKLVAFALLVFITTISYGQESIPEVKQDNTVSTYYLIRHAEKDRSNSENKNPDLITAGHERALKWREALSNVTFDAIYSTEYNRTKQTAQPIANKNKLKMHTYDPKTMDMELFQYHTKGKTVLVVGHSNTTPAFVNKLIGEEKYKPIDDSNNSNLYIVTIINGVASSNLLYIN